MPGDYNMTAIDFDDNARVQLVYAFNISQDFGKVVPTAGWLPRIVMPQAFRRANNTLNFG